VLYVGYHAESTFLALKCILLYIWSVYKYSFGHILQPVQIFLFSVTYFEQLRLSIFNLKKKCLFQTMFGSNSTIGFKFLFKNVNQWLGLSIFDPTWVETTQHFLECTKQSITK